MGIHTGSGVLGGDDYVGVDVNRAARIAGAAHGAQVLLSEATRTLVADRLPDGVRAQALGSYRLKDLPGAEALAQLEIRGLPAAFPPLRALDVRRAHLPPEQHLPVSIVAPPLVRGQNLGDFGFGGGPGRDGDRSDSADDLAAADDNLTKGHADLRLRRHLLVPRLFLGDARLVLAHHRKVSSPSGLAFTIGGIAAIAAFIGGLALVGPSVAEQTAVRKELAEGDGVPTETQRRRLESADGLMRLATRIDLPLILLAGLTMAVGRYL